MRETTPKLPKHLHPSVITRYAEAELLRATVTLLKQFPNAQVCHVYGHQDDDIGYDTLPVPAQLNVDCDKGAKKCMSESETDTTRPIPAPGSRAVLFLGTEMVTSHLQDQIQYAGQAEEMLQYIADNFEWTDAQARCVNYQAIETQKSDSPTLDPSVHQSLCMDG